MGATLVEVRPEQSPEHSIWTDKRVCDRMRVIMAVEIYKVVLGVLGTAAVLGLPPYVINYYHWWNDQRKYPEASRIFISLEGGKEIVNEEEVRGSARFLVDEAKRQLQIASLELKASVWNEQTAASLQRVLKKHPRLQVQVLTGQQITGDARGKHPFYLACRQEPERVSLATLSDEEFTYLQGVRADGQLFRKTGLSDQELAPASIIAFRNYGKGDNYWQADQAWQFKRDFAVLWERAEKWPATIMPQAT